MRWVWISALGPLCIPASPGAAQDLPQASERVRTILAGELRDRDPAVRQRYADALLAALGTASPAQASKILSNLNQAVGYHAAVVELVRERHRDADLPAELVQEGYDLEFQYLTQRVLRAARNEWTDGTRQAVVDQIDSLAQSLQASLKGRIGGEAGSQYIDQEVEKIRKSWTGSLDLPLNRFLDAPIPPEQLESIKQEIAAGVAGFSPVELTAADVSSRERLAELGVLGLVADARERGYQVGQFCFAEYHLQESRCREWRSKVEAQFGRRRAKTVPQEKEKGTAPAVARLSDPSPPVRPPPPAADSPKSARPGELPGIPAVPPMHPEDRLAVPLKAALVIAFLGGALGLGWAASRRLRSR